MALRQLAAPDAPMISQLYRAAANSNSRDPINVQRLLNAGVARCISNRMSDGNKPTPSKKVALLQGIDFIEVLVAEDGFEPPTRGL
jgi:hypothetical protein